MELKQDNLPENDAVSSTTRSGGGLSTIFEGKKAEMKNYV